MAQAYVADGDTDRAIEEFKLALAYDPDSAIILSRMAAGESFGAVHVSLDEAGDLVYRFS